MIVAIHQPQFMPWLGYFDKMDRTDVFVFLDNVQFKKNEWQNRNRIKTAKGWQWLTVPVSYHFPELINRVRVNNNLNWQKKHLHALLTNYRKAPFFDLYFPHFKEFYKREWGRLVDLNIESVILLKDILGIPTRTCIASQLGEMGDDPTGRLIGICKALGADTYLAGKDGRNYMDLEAFEGAGLRVIFQDFHHPVYPQPFGGFEPCMSAIDLVFNCGPGGLTLIRKENGR